MATIRIGSFNVHNLSEGQGRNLSRIAKMINGNHLDIIALQEVLSEGKIIHGIGMNNLRGQAQAYDRSLKSRLLGQWESEWQQPMVRGKNEQYLGEDKRGEGYAILWRSNKFILPKDENGKDIRPHIFSGYHAPKDGLRLIRDPLLARFCLKDKKVAELRLLVTHIVYGKPSGTEGIVDAGATLLRKAEFETLAGRVYRSVAEYYKQISTTSPYTILLGDYNLDLKSSGAPGPYIPDVMMFDPNGRRIDNINVFCQEMSEGTSVKNHTIYTEQTGLSTLKQDNSGYAHNYDHFSFDERAKRIVNGRSIQVLHDFVEKEGGDRALEIYKKEVSDHVPVIIEVNI